MFRSLPSQFSVVVVCLWIGGFLTSGECCAQRPFPTFTGGRVSVSGVSEADWAPLTAFISQVEADSRQTYFIVVVRSSGSGSRATVNYTDRLYAEWQKQSASTEHKLDARRAMIIVLATENRQLAVHAGVDLQENYGLRGQAIDRNFVVPHFIPFARANNQLEGLKQLITKFEQAVDLADSRIQQRSRQSAAVAKRVRKDAVETLISAERVAANIHQLITEQSEAGLELSRYTEKAKTIQSALGEISQTIDSDARGALRNAAAQQKSLVSLGDEIRLLSSTQQTAQLLLASLRTQHDEANKAVEAASRNGLAVQPIGTRLDRLSQTLDIADVGIQKDPVQAVASLSIREQELKKIQTEIEGLVARKQAIAERISAAEQTRKLLDADLARAESLGVPIIVATRQLEEIDGALTDARLSSVWDYEATEVSLKTAESKIAQQRKALTSSSDDKYFWSRTLPARIAIAVAGCILLVLAVFRFLHLRRRWALESQLKDYKTKVVDLSDSLDALKKRHQMLPFSDTDFEQPMAGETLKTYENIEVSLEDYRQRWLTLMDAWQAVQHSFEDEHYFGHSKLQDAQVLLDEAPVDDVVDSIRVQCEAMLDVLEAAHETQLQTESKVMESLKRLKEQIDDVAAENLATTAYELELQAAMDKREAMIDQRIADPLSNQRVLEYVLSEVVRIGKWSEQILHHRSGMNELSAKHEKLIEETSRHRREGFLFCEEGSDPGELFSGIRRHRDECLVLLNSGEAKTAAEHLTQGFGLIASAQERIDQQVSCQETCKQETKLRSEEQYRLRQAFTVAQAAHGELGRSFCESSWQDVADNPALAERAIDDCDEVLREAIRNGDDDVQFYMSAAEQFKQIQQRQTNTSRLLEAVSQRLAELEALRDRVQNDLGIVSGLRINVSQMLNSSAADRTAANQRFRHAETAFSRAKDLAAAGKADWQAVVDQLNVARNDFEASRTMAERDIQLARQASHEVSQADRSIRSAGSFYRQGFRANTSMAAHQLAQASQLLNSQDYEAAIRLANQAIASARDAVAAAENQAQAKQREQQRLRRQRLAAATSQQSSFGNQQRSFGRSGFDVGSSSGSFGSGTSVSSWESGTSSSSW